MTRARKQRGSVGQKVLHEKLIDEQGGITELIIWQVPESAQYPEGIRYRCAYIPSGQAKPAVLYDLHRGKSHHKHYLGTEQPYRFRSVEQLIYDFRTDVSRVKREKGGPPS